MRTFKFFLLFSISQKQNVYHKVLIGPIITSLITKTISQLLPCETQLAAVGVVAIPSKRQEKYLFFSKDLHSLLFKAWVWVWPQKKKTRS